MNEKKAEKDEISKQMGEKRQEDIAQKDALNKMQKSMPYGTEEEIDKRIATIEFKMMHESVPIREEKKMLQEIQELKKSRPKIARVHNLKAQVQEGKADQGRPLKERKAQINEDMAQLFEQKSSSPKNLRHSTKRGRKRQGTSLRSCSNAPTSKRRLARKSKNGMHSGKRKRNRSKLTTSTHRSSGELGRIELRRSAENVRESSRSESVCAMLRK